MQQTITYAGVAARSFNHASELLDHLGGLDVDPKQVERLTRKIGDERLAERDAATDAWRDLPVPQKFGLPTGQTAPDLAVVQCDGGRMQIFDRPSQLPPDTPPDPQPPAAAVADASADADGNRAGSGDAEPAAAVVADTSADAQPVSSSAAEGAEEFEEEVVKAGHWREERVGLLLTMKSTPSATDPCPDIPDCFLDESRIGVLVRQLGKCARQQPAEGLPEAVNAEAASRDVATPSTEGEGGRVADPAGPKAVVYQPPEVQQRQVVGTTRPWKSFAPQLAAAAWALGFMGAARKAFVGDGSANNWRLHKKFFSSFVAVLDFIHALSYVYAAAMAGRGPPEGWSCYRRWIEWVWQGQVAVVIEELSARQTELGEPTAGEPETSVRSVVSKALRYLRNQQDKMHYDEYRRQGLPITSSLMESAVKQMNQRVKGTEKFWSSGGGEAIVQLRADQLSDGDPLEAFWQRRQAAATGQRPYRRHAG